jgi:hypothetical protein
VEIMATQDMGLQELSYAPAVKLSSVPHIPPLILQYKISGINIESTSQCQNKNF